MPSRNSATPPRSPATPDGTPALRGAGQAITRFRHQPHRLRRAAPDRRRRRPAGDGRARRRARSSRRAFPDLIDPVQPMMNLRAITHEPAPGLQVTCRMEGDTFEMEDQRNWTDASYKTYVRPLALPWPYTLPAGSELKQAVTLTRHAATAPPRARRPTGAVAVRVRRAGGHDSRRSASASSREDAGGRSPLPTAARRRARTMSSATTIRAAAHDRDDAGKDASRSAQALGADAVARSGGHRASTASSDEIAALGASRATLGSPFATVLVSPASDLKSHAAGQRLAAVPAARRRSIARRAAPFPAARLGGGMFSYFTELNRKRPPLERARSRHLHHLGPGPRRRRPLGRRRALEALPYIARSARALHRRQALCMSGPSAIGMRDNPYGAAPMENPRQHPPGDEPQGPAPARPARAAGLVSRLFRHMARSGALDHARRRSSASSARPRAGTTIRSLGSTSTAASIRPITSSGDWRR